MLTRTLLIAILGLGLAACSSGKSYRDKDVEMVPAAGVDLERYMGRWFEIARFPNRFERGCVGVTADYSLNPDGTVRVVNTCRKATLAGPVEQAEGSARVEDGNPATLRVSFVEWLPSFLDGDYWILDVAADYSVAVVGDPDGDTGWILAREPVISEDEIRRAYDVLWRNGYDLGQIMQTDQPGVGS